jgi:sugar phosphate isomerase/epimerase
MGTLAVQSYCFREFKDNAKVAAMVRELGLDAIELCAVHCDFTRPEGFEAALGAYRQAGVKIVSIGVQTFRNEPAKEANYFKFAKLAGADTISANFRPGDWPESVLAAEKLAGDNGVNLAIHNHGGGHWLGSAQMLEAVFARTGPRLGLMLDTAWALDAGEDPVKMAEKFAPRLHGLHLKDFTFDRARKPRDVVVGTGNLDLPGLFKALARGGFKGKLILEYEGDAKNPVPALKECVAAVRKVMA